MRVALDTQARVAELADALDLGRKIAALANRHNSLSIGHF
jgi:hypothetical protein